MDRFRPEIAHLILDNKVIGDGPGPADVFSSGYQDIKSLLQNLCQCWTNFPLQAPLTLRQ